MQKYIFLLVAAVIVFFIATEMRLERERIPTEAEKVSELLEDYVFIRPREVSVLFNETTVDNQRREKTLIMVLKSDQEYQPKSQRIPDNSNKIINLMNDSLPDYDFGTPIAEEANFFRMLTADSDWKVSTIETSKGYFSRWKRVTDTFSATSLE